MVSTKLISKFYCHWSQGENVNLCSSMLMQVCLLTQTELSVTCLPVKLKAGTAHHGIPKMYTAVVAAVMPFLASEYDCVIVIVPPVQQCHLSGHTCQSTKL